MARKMVQLPLRGQRRGGPRLGAGRPRKKGAGVSHLRRPRFPGRFPLHVTLKIRAEVGNLRTDKRFRQIQRSFFHACDHFGMRLIQFSVQGNHIHLIVEAQDQASLSRGMQGLAIRLARGMNRLGARTGKVFADRYHARVLRTPSEVRNAVHYVLHNQRKHEQRYGRAVHPWYLDPFSSASGEACWYVDDDGSALIVTRPRTWLLLQN